MTIKYWGLSFWLSFMGLGPVFAATSPENISDFMLENGMQVVVIRTPRARCRPYGVVQSWVSG